MAYPGQPGYPGAPQQGYGAPQQGYGAPQQGYGAPQPGYPGAPQQGYPGAPQQGYPGAPGYGGAPGSGQPGYGSAPAMDPQVQGWFQSVDQDRSGRITAAELQRALVNTNWTQFNEETCRLMIGMFDKDFSGTIDMYEFQALWHYIQQWRSTFDRYDTNKSGSIDGNELLGAFQTMGYSLSPQFVQTVVTKFDHYGRRCLTLDNFIQASVMLKALTDAFKQRDPSLTGRATVSYEDFMVLSVLHKP